MKKKTMLKRLLMSVCSLTAGMFIYSGGVQAADNIAVNAVNFPDNAFRGYISSNVDTDANGILSAAEMSSVTEINVKSRGVSNLTGIGYFTSLQKLNCSGNNVSSVALEGNTELSYLNISNNDLTSLSISKNSKMATLMCSGNKLTSLDLTANTMLNSVDVSGNDLSTIDISKCSKLTMLNVSDNSFTSLDLSGNTLLNMLSCFGNQLTALEVKANTSLSSIDAGSNKLALLDVAANTQLTYLDCSNNIIMALKPSASIETLICNNNDLYSLKLQDLSRLKKLNAASNKLYSLDTAANKELEYIDVSNNCLSAADFSSNTLLKSDAIKMSGNSREIYVSTSTYFADLNGTALDVTKMTGVSNATVNASAASDSALSIGNKSVMPSKVTYTYNVGNDHKEEFTLVPVTTMKLVPESKNISIYISDKASAVEYPIEMIAIGGSPEITWASSNSTVAMVTNEGKLIAVAAGNAIVTANAPGFKPAVFNVNVYKQITKVDVADVADQFYTGSAIAPLPVVKAGDTTLVKDVDYKVAYENNVEVGTAVIKVTGLGKYSFTVQKKFKICYNIANLTADAIADQMYTGLAVTPNVVIKNGTYTLVKDVDYKLAYANNVAKGTAIVTVTGIGKYSGFKIQSFNIAIPQVLKLTKTGNSQKQIVLKWDAITGVTGYRIYRYNPTTKKYEYLKQVNGSAVNTYTDTGLTAGTEYRYRVRAFVTVNNVKTYGKYSTKFKTATKLKKVTLTVKSGKKKASLSWKKITGSNGYRVYMKTGSGKFSKVKEITKAGTIKYTKSGLTKGKTYYFRVRAFKTVAGVKIFGTYSTTKTVIAK